MPASVYLGIAAVAFFIFAIFCIYSISVRKEKSNEILVVVAMALILLTVLSSIGYTMKRTTENLQENLAEHSNVISTLKELPDSPEKEKAINDIVQQSATRAKNDPTPIVGLCVSMLILIISSVALKQASARY